MGAYTCEFGVVHKVCRCPTPHTIKCDNVAEHSGAGYVPKHRAESGPVVKYRITVVESQRGWGRYEWTEDYDTREEAQGRIEFLNSDNEPGPVPDYYMKAYTDIQEVTL